MKKTPYILILLFGLLLTACSDDDNPVAVDQFEGIRGAYVLNEGVFGNNNSSLSFFNFETEETNLNIFTDQNDGKLLGDTGNNMFVFGQLVYIVVSTSNKIEVMDLTTGDNVGTLLLNGKMPREVIVVDDSHAFVTCSANNTVYEFDPTSLTLTDSVIVGPAPESIKYLGGSIFVADNGWGSGRTISVIDFASFSLTKTITVGFNPVNIASDGNENIYAVCVGGWSADETKKGIYKISSSTLEITDSLSSDFFPSFPGEVAISNEKLYVVDAAGVNEINLANFELGELIIPTAEVVTGGNQWATIYGIAYDKKEDLIYCGNPKDFIQDGNVSVFNKEGVLQRSFDCGINPGTIVIVNP